MVSFVPVSFTVPKLEDALGGTLTKAATTAGGVAASAAGTVATAQVGAVVGTIVAGPVGTVIGGVVGGLVSQFVGHVINEAVTDTAYAYCFFIANNSASTIQIDVSEIFQSQNSPYTGNISVAPQTSQQVFFSIPHQTIEVGSTPLLSLGNVQVNFQFHSGTTNGTLEQYINIIADPNVSVTMDQSYQNNATVGGFTVGVGGNGGPLIGTNIWIIVNNA